MRLNFAIAEDVITGYEQLRLLFDLHKKGARDLTIDSKPLSAYFDKLTHRGILEIPSDEDLTVRLQFLFENGVKFVLIKSQNIFSPQTDKLIYIAINGYRLSVVYQFRNPTSPEYLNNYRADLGIELTEMPTNVGGSPYWQAYFPRYAQRLISLKAGLADINWPTRQ